MSLEDTVALTLPVGWPTGKYGAILADPPWRFQCWSGKGTARAAENHYGTLDMLDLAGLAVGDLAADDSILFLWATWPLLSDAMALIPAWGFEYKTCAFCWTKADGRQIEMFQDFIEAYMGLGYWTRANSEVCLLATRGSPKRLNADVKQAIVEPRREHSRKPDCVYERIERLVEGPYLEIFARTKRDGWTSWGNEVGKFANV